MKKSTDFDLFFEAIDQTCFTLNNYFFIAYNSLASVPRRVRVGYSTVTPGQQVTVPIKLDSRGDETGVSFSLSYDPARLSTPVVNLGSNAGGAILIPNILTSGKVGVVLSKAGGFGGAGTKEIVTITFNTVANFDPNTPVSFADHGRTRRDCGT